MIESKRQMRGGSDVRMVCSRFNVKDAVLLFASEFVREKETFVEKNEYAWRLVGGCR